MKPKKNDILIYKIKDNSFFTFNKKYKITRIYMSPNYGECITVIDNIGEEVNYSIELINKKNYESFFFTKIEQRKQKLQKLQKLTTEEKTMKLGTILIAKFTNEFLTKNNTYKVTEIYHDDNYGECITIIDNDGLEINYTIDKVNGENYENYFTNIKEQRKQKLKKLKTEEK